MGHRRACVDAVLRPGDRRLPGGPDVARADDVDGNTINALDPDFREPYLMADALIKWIEPVRARRSFGA